MNRYSGGKGLGAVGGWFPRTRHRPSRSSTVQQRYDAYFSPERESEWEIQEAGHYINWARVEEAEAEDNFFFQRTLYNIQKIAQATAPIARQIGAIAAKRLMPSTQRRERLGSPWPNPPIKIWLREGELEAAYLEAEWFGYSAAELEIPYSPIAHDAALSEVLAAEASHTHSENEAAALMGAALPITIRTVSGRRIIRPLIPILLATNIRLVRSLFHRGPAGRRLLRLVPAIVRRTIISLGVARRMGYPLSSNLIERIMASHTARVFGNPRLVSQLMIKNAVIRQQTVSSH